MRNKGVVRALGMAFGIACSTAMIAAAQGNSDIYLAPITRMGDSIVLGKIENVTHRPGYDNQPSFLQDVSGFLYTAIAPDGQADIWRYDIKSKQSSRVTKTPDSKYSATVMPDGERFSVIRVERDSAQRLWSYALDGTDPKILLPDLKHVGYHVWLDYDRLVVYVVGTPTTLHVVNREGTEDQVRATDVGRALFRLAFRLGFTYTQRADDKSLWIIGETLDGDRKTRIIRAPADDEYHAWTPDGILLTISQGKLVRWNSKLGDLSQWLPTADLSGAHITKASRLAVSPDGHWLAFVAEPAEP